MTRKNPILHALVGAVRDHLASSDRSDSKASVSDELGLDARRFARVMSRKTVTDEDVQQMLRRYMQRNPGRPLEVVIGPENVRVQPSIDLTHEDVNGSVDWLQVAANNVLTRIRQHCDAITTELEHAVGTLDAKRVMLLRASRGPLGESETYSSIVAEVALPGFPLAGTHWSTVPLSEDYCLMLEELQRQGHVELRTSELADEALRELYERQGIRRSVVWSVTKAGGSLWYVSAVQTEDKQIAKDAFVSVKEALTPHCLSLERFVDGG